ncbi:MAG TPA: 1-deoxy-D-xylulose-5-phosphate synthase, partial [Chitinispirillaceae bacterium]|nr:1-deoxy-D-xylulose-5-phosphate synthase [Chitinispirillaceae bacterium]
MSKRLLDSVNSPADLKKLQITQLPELASEIRDMMIETVSKCGGHLAPSLGTVELTIALHYCYNSPDDKIIWDVGHQAYTHKILTGRRDVFHTLRQQNGICGFPKRSESPHDVLTVGHASTSISAGLGMAEAHTLLGEKNSVVAVIGDGALSGGLAFEGLNNLGSSKSSMTVILNDNEMSISRNVGALSRYLTMMLTDKRYNKIKKEVWNRLSGSNVGKSILNIVSSIDDALKHIVIPGKLFEDMGIRYFGPVDGHDITSLIDIFKSIKDLPDTRVLIHVITKKGKGYSYAECDATKYHGISSFSRETGDVIKFPSNAPTYSEVFGKTIVDLAREHKEIVAITAAMRDGTKLVEFSKEFPDRFFDVGIAEGHAVTFAAGLALKGLRPVIALYSTFAQRAYDHIMHDVAIESLPVIFCIDRAGLVGDDGPTHHGMFDLSFLRTVPGAVIMAPRNEAELKDMIFTAFEYTLGPVFIRYPRGNGIGVPLKNPYKKLEIGVPEVLKEGTGIAVLSIGDCIGRADKVCNILEGEGFSPQLIDARFAKPLDETFYSELFKNFDCIVTIENNSKCGGFGSAVLEMASSLQLDTIPRILVNGL